MSHSGVWQVVEKALSDEIFRSELISFPDMALSGFDLTVAEREAIKSGDVNEFDALNLDRRAAQYFMNLRGFRTYQGGYPE